MTLVGISYTTNSSGIKTSTLHISDDFNAYYFNSELGRGCLGKKTDSIYVGNYDITGLKIGMEIDVLYDKAITTAKGTFQTIKRIDVISKG